MRGRDRRARPGRAIVWGEDPACGGGIGGRSSTLTDGRGLIFAYILDGRGGGREVGWDAVASPPEGGGPLWAHLDRGADNAERWLTEESGIDPVVCEALLAEETRPRVVRHGDGLLTILRGINLNPGADPEDIVSIRMWADARRLISLRRRHLMAIEDVRAEFAAGRGPAGPGDLFVAIIEQLSERMGRVLSDLNEAMDDLEEEVIEAESYTVHSRLGTLRRGAIAIKRYLAPQREVLHRLQTERVEWIADLHRVRLREAADRITRYVEDLDATRDRAAVTQDELNSKLSERMNKTMYVLSIIAAIFLPLGLITGLLGVNVGGIPWADSRAGFALVTAFLVALAGGLVLLFKRLKWL